MKTQELIYRLALHAIKGIGPIRAKRIIDQLGDTSLVFSSSKKFLKHEMGLSDQLIAEILGYHQFNACEQELRILQNQHIKVLCHDAPNYPSLLKQCADAPALLYLNGKEEALQQPCIAVIGTRHHSDYGRRLCEDFISELSAHKVTMVSGLAFGIDGIAHRAALKQQLPTYGVLAHGLKELYPPSHSALSKEMQAQGGLLTEYSFFTKASREYFPARNRIVAGMCSATVIIETDIRGGSMITADLAYSYNREVFCFPGRADDRKSAGCNYLIKNLKAQLITSANDVIEALGWKEKPRKNIQRSLFVDFNVDERSVVDQLQQSTPLHYDELCLRSGLHTSHLSNVLLHLELQGIVEIKPGKMVGLV